MTDFLVANLRYLTSAVAAGDQSTAGTAAGVGQPAVSKIINGRTREPGYKTVMGLAKHFGVSVDDLLNRDLALDGALDASHAVGPDDATMAQAIDLLYLMGNARPEDRRFDRLNWAMIKIAAKGIQRSDGDPRKAMAVILEELSQER